MAITRTLPEKDSTEGYETQFDRNTDAADVRGVYVQNDTSNDANVLVTRDASDNLLFTDGVTGTKTLAQLASGGSTATARPNMLRNSGFWFAQCQTPGTLTNMGTVAGRRNYGPDGWFSVCETSLVQYARVDTDTSPETALSGRYYGRFVKTTNAGKLLVCQAVESIDCQHVRGSQVRVQVKLKASASVTWRLGLVQLASAGTADTFLPPPADTHASGTFITAWNGSGTDPTLNATQNYVYIAPDASNTDNTTVSGNALTCSVTTTWQRFGGTFTVPTDCHNLIVVLWSNAQMAASDEIKMAEVSMCLGTDIAVWAPQAWSSELLRCQRYVLKTFYPDTAPAQNAGGLGDAVNGIAGKSGANSNYLTWRFPVPLRVSALDNVITTGFPFNGIKTYNPSAANANARNITTNADMAITGTIIADRTGVTFTITGVGGGGGTSVGDRIAIHLLIFGEL